MQNTSNADDDVKASEGDEHKRPEVMKENRAVKCDKK
jgi:hypothetical protein